MCDRKGPVREVLAKSSMQQVQSAYETAKARYERAKAEGDKDAATLFKRVADDMEAELSDRILAFTARGVLKESAEMTKQARELLNQAVNR